MCQGYLLESLQGTMSCRVTPAQSPRQTLLVASVSSAPTISLHFQLLLIRDKKASTQLPPQVSSSQVSLFVLLPGLFPSLSVPALVHLPPHTLLLGLLHGLFSFTSCTLITPPSLTNHSGQSELKLSLLPGNPGPHKSLGNPRGLY